MVRKIKRCTKPLCKTKKELIKEDVKQKLVNGKTNMMVRNISRSYEASAKWKQQLSKEYDISTNKNVNIKSNALERKINRSDEVLPKWKRDYDLYFRNISSSSSLSSDENLQKITILKVDESRYSDLFSYEDNVSSDDKSRFQVIKDNESHSTNNILPKLSQITMTLTQHDIDTMENNTL